MRVDEENTPLERLYARLTSALQSQRSEPWSAPVTVAEIYQELVPYRIVRGEAGFAMNADYEHALLRLLSGEGDWARLEPPSAREVIERELRSPNPNVTIYREYAACDVWIKTPRAGLQAAGSGGPPAQPDDAELEELELLAEEIEEREKPSTFALDEAEPSAAPAPAPSAPAPPAPAPPAPAPPAPQPQRTPQPAPQSAPQPPRPTPGATAGRAATSHGQAAAAGNEAQGSRCAFCDSRLPSGRKVRFCPFCGGDQSMVPCATCGEALESAWLFCVACGTSAPIP
jgi:hypothetical protein